MPLTAAQRRRRGRNAGLVGGLSRSPAKIAAVRENGKLGGRPVGSRTKKTARRKPKL